MADPLLNHWPQAVRPLAGDDLDPRSVFGDPLPTIVWTSPACPGHSRPLPRPLSQRTLDRIDRALRKSMGCYRVLVGSNPRLERVTNG
ncbi:hypothetical protein [Phenylobacterium sp.]|uniref:hypothetical protein n=1 Tax=Phenylobacterium sp. TaxID=1871053 RepID=UPI0025F47747|nr:hypothetical protein [Phenylobacterium sp.]MBX3482518.1 hypothetical protein [Phenylobacterium sp.]MCW5758265.1 hypothetical protein [Phenylobacterium sp.]